MTQAAPEAAPLWGCGPGAAAAGPGLCSRRGRVAEGAVWGPRLCWPVAPGLSAFLSLQAPWLRSGPGRYEALAARARLVGVSPARGPGPRGARSGQCRAEHGSGSRGPGSGERVEGIWSWFRDGRTEWLPPGASVSLAAKWVNRDVPGLLMSLKDETGWRGGLWSAKRCGNVRDCAVIVGMPWKQVCVECCLQ